MKGSFQKRDVVEVCKTGLMLLLARLSDFLVCILNTARQPTETGLDTGCAERAALFLIAHVHFSRPKMGLQK